MQTADSVGPAMAWKFRIMLLLAAIACLLGTIINTMDRLAFTMDGVPATIRLAKPGQKPPADWSDYKGRLRAAFDVRVKTGDGRESFANLYLAKDVVDGLLQGKEQEIIFHKDDPRRFMMKGEPFPPFGLGWLLAGLALAVVFLYSLRQR